MHVYTWQPVTEVDARVIEENQKALALIDHVYMQKMYKDAFALQCIHECRQKCRAVMIEFNCLISAVQPALLHSCAEYELKVS